MPANLFYINLSLFSKRVDVGYNENKQFCTYQKFKIDENLKLVNPITMNNFIGFTYIEQMCLHFHRDCNRGVLPPTSIYLMWVCKKLKTSVELHGYIELLHQRGCTIKWCWDWWKISIGDFELLSEHIHMHVGLHSHFISHVCVGFGHKRFWSVLGLTSVLRSSYISIFFLKSCSEVFDISLTFNEFEMYLPTDSWTRPQGWSMTLIHFSGTCKQRRWRWIRLLIAGVLIIWLINIYDMTWNNKNKIRVVWQQNTRYDPPIIGLANMHVNKNPN